jgi:hypothetical protein
MEDPDQVQAVGLDPLERVVLFLSIHAKAHRTLVCVPHPEHCPQPNLVSRPATRRPRAAPGLLRALTHRLQVFGFQFQDSRSC